MRSCKIHNFLEFDLAFEKLMPEFEHLLRQFDEEKSEVEENIKELERQYE